MKVLDFILCEDVQTAQLPNGFSSNLLQNPIGIIIMETVPSQYSFTIFIMMSEVNDLEYSLSLLKVGKDEPIFEGRGQHNLSNINFPVEIPREAFVINNIVRVNNVFFESEGDYAFTLKQGDYFYEKRFKVQAKTKK